MKISTLFLFCEKIYEADLLPILVVYYCKQLSKGLKRAHKKVNEKNTWICSPFSKRFLQAPNVQWLSHADHSHDLNELVVGLSIRIIQLLNVISA